MKFNEKTIEGTAPYEMPPHSKTCLLKRVLLNAVGPLTSRQIIEDICEEFPYYREIRSKKHKLLFYTNFQGILSSHDDIFKYNRSEKNWTLASPEPQENDVVDNNEDEDQEGNKKFSSVIKRN